MENHFLELKSGLRIHSIIAGDAGQPPLVLLHGYPANAELWRHCIPALANQFRIYAPDLPGHGRSDKPLHVDYDLDFFVEFLLDYLDAAGLAHPCLAAHDWGGMAALGFVSRHPHRVKRFVVMNTAPYADWSIRLRIITKAIGHPLIGRITLRPFIFKQVFRWLLIHDTQKITNETIMRYRQSWVESRDSREAFRYVIRMPPERITEPLEKIKKISVPTLVLWGAEDPFLKIDTARRLSRDIPGATLIPVPGCGHFLQEERPQEVVRHMCAFLLPSEKRRSMHVKTSDATSDTQVDRSFISASHQAKAAGSHPA